VIGIIGLLAATLLPAILGAKESTNISVDQMQLRKHHYWIELYRTKYKSYPREGGCKFVLDTWVRPGVVEHTEQNFAFYFNPRTRAENDTFNELSKGDLDKLWSDLAQVNSQDTDYAGRAKEWKKDLADSGREAMMADDNEDGLSFRDGTINVLFGDGSVKELHYEDDIMKKYGLGPLDPAKPVPTCGKSSPVPELQKLEK